VCVCVLPEHPKMSHTLMMSRILRDEAGLGRGDRKLLRFGRICNTQKKKLRLALHAHIAVKSRGAKLMTNSVAGSRFGQQKVSSRGDAMAMTRRKESAVRMMTRRRRKRAKRMMMMKKLSHLSGLRITSSTIMCSGLI